MRSAVVDDGTVAPFRRDYPSLVNRVLCEVTGVPGPAKAVLLVLAEHASDELRCWPSFSRIASLSCFSEMTVRRAISFLQNRGLVEIEKRKGCAHIYRLNLDAQPPQPRTERTRYPDQRERGTPFRENRGRDGR